MFGYVAGLTMTVGRGRDARLVADVADLDSADHVLDIGFLEILERRNRQGRMLGGEDYYDWKVKNTEGLSKLQVFDLLDELEEKT